MNELRIEIFDSFEGAEAHWRAYEALCDHFVFQTFDWTAQWFADIGQHRRINIFLVDVRDQDGAPLAFLPLGTEWGLFAQALVWLGGDITDYLGPLLTADGARRLRGDDLEQLWIHLQKRSGAAYADLSRQPTVIGDLENPFAAAGRLANSQPALNTALEGEWSTYYAVRRGKKTRHNDRRKRRKLEAMGSLTFEVAETSAEIEKQVSAMLEQKDRYIQKLGKINSLRQQGHPEFLSRLARNEISGFQTLLCALKLDDEILAVQWGIAHRRRFFSIIASYDDGPYSRYSTGDMLLHELLAWCFDNDVEIVDFTCGEEAYKRAWCDRSLELQDRLLPMTSWGYVCVTIRLATNALRRHASSSPTLRGAVSLLRRLGRNGPLSSSSPHQLAKPT